MEDYEKKTELWLAYQSDYSQFVIFDNELDALRSAVETLMCVRQISFGEEIV